MAGKQHHVMIKGRKDGLVFILNDRCPFSELLSELEFKLEKTHQRLLSGPLVHVHVKLGERQITETERQSLEQLSAAATSWCDRSKATSPRNTRSKRTRLWQALSVLVKCCKWRAILFFRRRESGG